MIPKSGYLIETDGFKMKIMFAVIFVLLVIGFGETGLPAWAASDQPRAFDAERLRKLHDRLLADYPVERKKFLSTSTNLAKFNVRLTDALDGAGVKELLDDAKAGLIPSATRIAILNDYGFWLSKTNDPRNAVPVLQKVVELAPTRAVAQLNLGDAARSSVTVAETWEQKTKFSAIGMKAYSAYQKLAGKDAPDASEFQALHSIGSVSENVCSYVAAFYNRGRQEEMWGYPDPVDIAGDGKLRHVYIFYQGTAHVPGIFASTKAVPEEERVMEGLSGDDEVDFARTVDQSSAEENGRWSEFHVLPFRDGYYLVYQEDGGPVAVVKPNAGTGCKFKRSFKPVLVEDHAPAICKEAFAGRAFAKLPREKLSGAAPHVPANDLNIGAFDNSQIDFEQYSDVKLDPLGEPARLGYFEIASGAGPGCSENGIAFLAGNRLEKSPRADALMETQSQMLKCGGSSAFPVSANGESLIEIDEGSAIQRTYPPRTLLRLRGDKFETVCRVDQRPTYIPQPVARSH